MGRGTERLRIDLHAVFLRVQQQMLANLASSRVFGHPTACGAATERHWIELFNRYLPQRYCASSVFVIDADGNRSRQIDIAIYDNFYAPRLFHDDIQPYIPAESVYAVFEVKQALSSTVIRDAGRKIASVRRLRRTSAVIPTAGSYPAKQPSPILGGVLCLEDSHAGRGAKGLAARLGDPGPDEHLDIGCSLGQWAFEIPLGLASSVSIQVSQPQEALIFFMLRLIQRLQQMGPTPGIDFGAYGRCLEAA